MFAGMIVLVLSLTLALQRPPAAAQPGGAFFQRFFGSLEVGRQPAPVGTEITVITARTATDTTVCGTGVVGDRDGGYTVDVGRTPRCASSRTGSRGVTYYFIVHGERAGSVSPAPFLDAPGGGTRRVNLRATEIPGFQWTPTTGDLTLSIVRFYGDVTAGRVPAPAGTEVTVIAEHSATDTPVCGTGTVVDDLGTYWVDVLPPEECATSRTRGRGLTYRLLVGGEVAGSSSPAPFFDNPGGLAGTRRLNLRVTQLPAPPPPPSPDSPPSGDE